MVMQFSYLGFTDCSTTNECGAFYIKGQSFVVSYICGYMCEAINNRFQLFNAECDIYTDNIFNYMAIAFCGKENSGHSAFSFGGSCMSYRISTVNSSHNYNYLNDESFGACFRVLNVCGFEVTLFNFLDSTGYDVFDSQFANTNTVSSGTFQQGNVVNCTSTYVFKFQGTNYLKNVYFDKLTYSIRAFEIDKIKPQSNFLELINCTFDVMPVNSYANVDFKTGCKTENPVETLPIFYNDFRLCPPPPVSTSKFSQSLHFSKSLDFTRSNQFTISPKFTFSQKFTLTDSFSHSNRFTSSKLFTRSNQFTVSSKFSFSYAFTSSQKFTLTDEFSPSGKFTFSMFFTRSNHFIPTSKFTFSDSFSPSEKFTFSKFFTRSNVFSYSILFSSSKELKSKSLSTFQFTISQIFSKSSKFTFTNSFSPSQNFTISHNFSPSTPFSWSIPFSSSNSFLPKKTNTFTPSNPFTASFTFSPNPTKYPDGQNNFHRADVSGRSFFDKPASAAAIGATAGISVILIIVSVVLMLLYLKSKRKQMKGHNVELSDEFLHDDSESSSDCYSYSYYTYEEYSVEVLRSDSMDLNSYSYSENFSFFTESQDYR